MTFLWSNRNKYWNAFVTNKQNKFHQVLQLWFLLVRQSMWIFFFATVVNAVFVVCYNSVSLEWKGKFAWGNVAFLRPVSFHLQWYFLSCRNCAILKFEEMTIFLVNLRDTTNRGQRKCDKNILNKLFTSFNTTHALFISPRLTRPVQS